MLYVEMDPAEELPVGVNWAYRKGNKRWLDEGEVIAQSTWTVPASLQKFSETILDGVRPIVWIRGVQKGGEYILINDIVTSSNPPKKGRRRIKIIGKEK